ncbi:hypothetical protein JCM15519_37090 [Fundidesulfovibrio butyratiphilus]
MSISRVFRLVALALALLLVVPAGLLANEVQSQGPTGKPIPPKPSGKVTMSFAEAAFVLGASGGKGQLQFRGKKYAFRVGGFSAGSLGVSLVDAEGQVFYLKRPQDLAGAYAAAEASYSAGRGDGVLWLKNTKGVVLKLKSTTKGVALTLGGNGLVIEMGAEKKK